MSGKQKYSDELVFKAYSVYEETLSTHKAAQAIGASRGMLRKRFASLGLPILNIRGGQQTRESNNNWKGGRIVQGGYVYISVLENDPFSTMRDAKGYVAEHRLVMARYLDRPLRKDETVHHIDGDRMNNSLTNLQLRIGNHGNGQAYCCADCGSINIVPQKLG